MVGNGGAANHSGTETAAPISWADMVEEPPKKPTKRVTWADMQDDPKPLCTWAPVQRDDANEAPDADGGWTVVARGNKRHQKRRHRYHSKKQM